MEATNACVVREPGDRRFLPTAKNVCAGLWFMDEWEKDLVAQVSALNAQVTLLCPQIDRMLEKVNKFDAAQKVDRAEFLALKEALIRAEGSLAKTRDRLGALEIWHESLSVSMKRCQAARDDADRTKRSRNWDTVKMIVGPLLGAVIGALVAWLA